MGTNMNERRVVAPKVTLSTSDVHGIQNAPRWGRVCEMATWPAYAAAQERGTVREHHPLARAARTAKA
jgi:hypothetical protein